LGVYGGGCIGGGGTGGAGGGCTGGGAIGGAGGLVSVYVVYIDDVDWHSLR